jgi:hypothetical protein
VQNYPANVKQFTAYSNSSYNIPLQAVEINFGNVITGVGRRRFRRFSTITTAPFARDLHT